MGRAWLVPHYQLRSFFCPSCILLVERFWGYLLLNTFWFFLEHISNTTSTSIIRKTSKMKMTSKIRTTSKMKAISKMKMISTFNLKMKMTSALYCRCGQFLSKRNKFQSDVLDKKKLIRLNFTENLSRQRGSVQNENQRLLKLSTFKFKLVFFIALSISKSWIQASFCLIFPSIFLLWLFCIIFTLTVQP